MRVVKHAECLRLFFLFLKSFPSFSFPGFFFVVLSGPQGAASLSVPGRVPVTSSYSSISPALARGPSP